MIAPVIGLLGGSFDPIHVGHLQLARDGEARKTMDETRYLPGASARFVAPYAMAAVPARYAFERGDWQAAAKIAPMRSSYPFVEAITYFARSLGAARSGDLPAAKKDAEQLDALHKALVDAKNTYWANEVDIQRMAAGAWIKLGEGNKDAAAVWGFSRIRLMSIISHLQWVHLSSTLPQLRICARLGIENAPRSTQDERGARGATCIRCPT